MQTFKFYLSRKFQSGIIIVALEIVNKVGRKLTAIFLPIKNRNTL